MLGIEQPRRGKPVIITRETDYALRILRALAEGGLLSTKEISTGQMVPLSLIHI